VRAIKIYRLCVSMYKCVCVCVCVYIHLLYSRGSMQIEGEKVEMYVDYLLSSLRPLMSLMRGPFTGALSYREKNPSAVVLNHHLNHFTSPVQPQLPHHLHCLPSALSIPRPNGKGNPKKKHQGYLSLHTHTLAEKGLVPMC
jgi:hypothetical protein